MKKKTMLVLAGVAGFSGIAALASMPVIAATTSTSVTATVTSTISCAGGSATIASITPGQAGTATAEFSVTTNSPAGFTATVNAVNALNHSSTSDKLAYNASAAAGTAGWYARPTTYSEWKTSTSGSAFTTSTAITANSVKTHSSYSATAVTDTINITVGTTSTTPSGTYSNSSALSWTCAAR